MDDNSTVERDTDKASISRDKLKQQTHLQNNNFVY